ncbi:MAG: ROK family glucokinase [Candidatus Carbobacillus altaicus]|nr:ROK family glucokinase [Candidatus Carbobacillus altaicus]
MRYALGVDLGGTAIKFGLVSEKGEIVERHQTPTPVDEGSPAIIQKIVEGIQRLGMKDLPIEGIGIGVPGLVEVDKGTVRLAPNLNWRAFPLLTALQDAYPARWVIENDANAALLGERWVGALQGVKHALMLTLGTGVGGAVLAEGRLVRGAGGVAGEIGHIPVNKSGVRCGCGRIGCLETEASAMALVRHTKEALKSGKASALEQILAQNGELTPMDISVAAEAGDVLAHDMFSYVADWLAFALGGLINTLNPEKVLIGGGLAYAGELLFAPLREALPRYTLDTALKDVTLERARLGNDAGMIGAAWLVLHDPSRSI